MMGEHRKHLQLRQVVLRLQLLEGRQHRLLKQQLVLELQFLLLS
jgi:hypothetical protein